MTDSNRIKIIADDKIPFLKGVLEPFVDIEYYPGKEITNDKCIDADALIIRTRTKCNKDLLDGTNVKLITTATIGYDHIDVEYCNENSIKWLNAPGCNSSSVQQYIAATLLHLAKEKQFELTNKTLGIVGVGNVGKKVKKVAEIFGMNVLLNDPPRERSEGKNNFSSLEQIKEKADIITFHVPLNKDGIDKTYHLGDDIFFNGLDKKPIIINSSRGEVIQTSSIKDAISQKKISDIVLDVWENEPEIDLELLEKTDISTPHIAGYSADGKANGTSVCVNAVSDYFNLGVTSNWYPDDISHSTSGNKIELNCANKNDQEIFEEVILFTYKIIDDDKNLKQNSTSFEKLRGDYPIRREFSDYYVKLSNCNSELAAKFTKLGFKVILDK